jgi:hypothetical protein
MRRTILTGALAGVFGLLMLVGDASACCHKRRAACAPAPCAAPAPCVATCAPARTGCCGHKVRHRLGLCHKKRAACAPAPVCYAGPMPAGQMMPMGPMH